MLGGRPLALGSAAKHGSFFLGRLVNHAIDHCITAWKVQALMILLRWEQQPNMCPVCLTGKSVR